MKKYYLLVETCDEHDDGAVHVENTHLFTEREKNEYVEKTYANVIKHIDEMLDRDWTYIAEYNNIKSLLEGLDDGEEMHICRDNPMYDLLMLISSEEIIETEMDDDDKKYISVNRNTEITRLGLIRDIELLESIRNNPPEYFIQFIELTADDDTVSSIIKDAFNKDDKSKQEE